MVTFIYPADIITGNGDEGESIYGPTFEGMVLQLSYCTNGKFLQKSSCLPDLIHGITWEFPFISVKQNGLLFSQNYYPLALARVDCFSKVTFWSVTLAPSSDVPCPRLSSTSPFSLPE